MSGKNVDRTIYIYISQDIQENRDFVNVRSFDRFSGLLRLKYGVFRASGLFNHGVYILRHIE